MPFKSDTTKNKFFKAFYSIVWKESAFSSCVKEDM